MRLPSRRYTRPRVGHRAALVTGMLAVLTAALLTATPAAPATAVEPTVTSFAFTSEAGDYWVT